MKKTKVFYIFDYQETPDLSKKISKVLDSKNFQVISDYYAQYNPELALKDIENHLRVNNTNIVVACGLGAYLAQFLNPNVKVFLIDKWESPVEKLDKLEATSFMIDLYKNYKEIEKNPNCIEASLNQLNDSIKQNID